MCRLTGRTRSIFHLKHQLTKPVTVQSMKCRAFMTSKIQILELSSVPPAQVLTSLTLAHKMWLFKTIYPALVWEILMESLETKRSDASR